MELIAEIHRQLGDKNNCLWVIAVDVKNRRLHHFCNVSAVLCRPCVSRLTGSKANLVIQHNVQGAARAVGTCLRHLERLHHHTLPSEGSIAVNHYGDH